MECIVAEGDERLVLRVVAKTAALSDRRTTLPVRPAASSRPAQSPDRGPGADRHFAAAPWVPVGPDQVRAGGVDPEGPERRPERPPTL